MKFKQFLEEVYACVEHEDVLNEATITSKNKYHLEQMDSYLKTLEMLLDISDSEYQNRFKSRIAKNGAHERSEGLGTYTSIHYISSKDGDFVKDIFSFSGPHVKDSHVPCEVWEGMRFWDINEVVGRLCYKTHNIASGLAERMHKDVKSASKSRKSQSKK